MKRLLEDITILDMGWVIAGPTGTRLLADLGATIIRVETRARADVIRGGAKREGVTSLFDEGGWLFQDINRGKFDISLNMKSPHGREVFEKLLKKSDALLCNFSPRAFKKMGLDLESLRKVKPDIIVLNASGMGDFGKYSDFATFAPILGGVTGYTSQVAYENEHFCEPRDSLPDFVGGAGIAVSLMAALAYKERTGKGQFVDLAQAELFLSVMGATILDCAYNQEELPPYGNQYFGRTMVPHNCYQCAGNDSWCSVAVRDDEEWSALCSVIDPMGEWSENYKYATIDGRIENRAEIDARVAAWMQMHTNVEAAETLQMAGVSAGMVQSAKDLIEDPHIAERKFLIPLDFPASDRQPETLLVTGMLSGNRDRVPESVPCAPSVGQHNDYILKTYLNLSDEEIQMLKEDGTIEMPKK